MRSILEPVDSVAVKAAALSSDQFGRVAPWMEADESGRASRLARLDGYARTLMATYRSGWQRHSEFLPHPIAAQRDASGTRAAMGAEAVCAGARFYTGREAARIMGFPESFMVPGYPTREHGSKAYDAYVRFYHQIGNAVCPPVISALAEPILRALEI